MKERLYMQSPNMNILNGYSEVYNEWRHYISGDYATGFVNPKITSLLFNRIWLPEGLQMELCGEKDIPNWIFATDFGKIAYVEASLANCGQSINVFKESENDSAINYYTSYYRNMSIKQYVSNIKERFNIDVTPVYHNATTFEKDFCIENIKEVNNNAIQICVTNFPEIDEKTLTWEQVIDIRKSGKHIALQRFRKWLIYELIDKDEDEILYIFEKELDNYRSTLHKFGVKTIVGGFTTLFSAIAAILERLNGGMFDNIATTLSITCMAATYTTQQLSDYSELRRYPIAYVYDVIKKVNK